MNTTTQPAIGNPHWRPDACGACHWGDTQGTRGDLRGSTEALCLECHGTLSQHAYVHPSGLRVGKDMLERMPPDYRQALAGGQRATCATCHDLPMQCLSERRKQQARNPMFLRGGPFQHRSDPCFLCHDAKAYTRLNPHAQLTQAGALRKGTCQMCHGTEREIGTTQGIDEVDFATAGDLSKLCTGCHPWVPHPGGSFMFTQEKRVDHLVRPSKAVLKRMQRMTAEHDIVLPLDPNTGKVFCATCHNPHQRGVLSAPAGQGADSKQRLREQKICIYCHDK